MDFCGVSLRQQVTVLFCDIDGFEETCREIEADAVLKNLTGVLGTIADEIHKQNGTFLEFISDEATKSRPLYTIVYTYMTYIYIIILYSYIYIQGTGNIFAS